MPWPHPAKCTSTTPRASIAVTAREWAKLNPKAFMREDLTVEDVLASRMVSSPLRLGDCCLVTDGGGAAIVTSAERARVLKETPVYL
jgi:acetyl-CoA acetyltransferase